MFKKRYKKETLFISALAILVIILLSSISTNENKVFSCEDPEDVDYTEYVYNEAEELMNTRLCQISSKPTSNFLKPCSNNYE